jgi:SAM-dependent methyltransferase
MSNFRFLIRHIWEGKSVTRAFLNLSLSQLTLKGKTIDIGGGKDTKYLSWMKKDHSFELRNFDMKTGDVVDFETEALPLADGSYDTVLFLNVMEHIFNYQHIAGEVVRIVKPEGQLIGFVPFLMWYHPDHSDYFRYTDEALEKIFTTAGAKTITITPIHRGPFTAACQMVMMWLPRLVRVPLFALLYAADSFFIKRRATFARHYALGYLFTVDM